ncbi:MAG TPA: alpha/beta hydrolase [Nocardioidaceae bacterium]|nr:alpha/beta hydrolase [Nocardioidaceae bacterium]
MSTRPKPIALGITRLLEKTGRAVTPVTSRLPLGRLAAQILTHSGFMLPVPDPRPVQRAVKIFLQTTVDWYMHLARAAGEHRHVSLRSVTVPTTFVAGKHDILASAHDMASAAARIFEAEYVVLNGSHFIAMEHPEQVHAQLLALTSRVHTPASPAADR